ncbi:MAG: hypothetical protein JWR63_197 [Conexibacter sp.]|nr:hypothetical protein [Conexibacter sp.]
MTSRRSDALRVLTVVAALPLVPFGWYWADGSGGAPGTPDGLVMIGVVMIVLALAAAGWCVLGRRLGVAAVILLGGWLCGIVGLTLAVSSLE